jgi:hypothetical protein
MKAIHRTLAVAAALAGALTFGSCKDDKPNCNTNPTGPGCPPPPTTQPAQTRNIIKTGSCVDVGVDVLCFFDPFSTTQRGDLDVTVDWTFPEDIIQVLVSNGTCSLDQINANQCTFIGTTPASATPKPRVVTIRGVAAGTYQLYVGNRGPNTESLSVQIGLTTPGTASSAAATRIESAIGRPYASQAAGH